MSAPAFTAPSVGARTGAIPAITPRPLPGQAPSKRPLRFGLEVLDHHFDQSNVLWIVEQNLARYGVEEVLFWGANNLLNETVVPAGYERYQVSGDRAPVDRFQSWLRRFEKHGVRLVADGREPHVSPQFFDAYPEARRVDSGILWDFLERRTEAIFQRVPELHRIESFLWETWLLSSDNYFEGLHWSEEGRGWEGGQFYEPVDYLVDMISAFARGAAHAGREYAQKCFFSHPWQEELLVDAILKVPADIPLRTSTQVQAGDFNPFNPPPLIVGRNQTRPMAMYFDCYGEYIGQSQVPYCNVEGFVARARDARRRCAALDTLRARINFADTHNSAKSPKHLFGTPNEVNLVALARAAKEPDVTAEDIWRDWASERYGPAVAPAVIRALRRTPEIVKHGAFFHGLGFANHSQVPSLSRIELWLPRELKDYERFRAHEVETLAHLRAFIHRPVSATFDELRRLQSVAKHLCDESLADLHAARRDLSSENHADLVRRFEFTHVWLHLYRLVGEVSLRLRCRPGEAPSGNRERIADLLSEMEKLAAHADAQGWDHYVIVNGPGIRVFVAEARSRAR